MKITYQWLKQYVEFPWTPEELAERLTMLGLEVERIERRSGEFEGVVVAQVISREKHPNADKLSVCRVYDGQGERQIVCGAQNFQAGDKVPLIVPGASLPPKQGEAAFTIKVGKIRGVESHGMMCSAEELGLPPKEDGLLILETGATVGRSLAEHLGRQGSDVIYDLEITPNRPDLNSLLGIAREVAAITGNRLREPSVHSSLVEEPSASSSLPAPVSELVNVRIEAPDLCLRYTARVICGVKVGPSPDWLRSTLEKVGLRSINNVVDVTNYVMLETGQPLHAFDSHLVAKGSSGVPTIVVRAAAQGEMFVTLDGQQRKLESEMLLIADEQKAIALAGVMGGKNTEIHAQTVDVLVESACFKPTSIRKTSKTLGLRTDASYRFERGSDVEICDWASQRAVKLILETAGGTQAPGVVDAYPLTEMAPAILLRHEKVGHFLGVEIPYAQQVAILVSLGFEVIPPETEGPVGQTVFRIPSFRVDIKREIDLIEEIARLFGVDKIPSTPPRGCVGSHAFDRVYDELMEARQLLSATGLSEAQGQTLIGDETARLLVKAENVTRLSNPLSAEMNVLRPSLLPGLLDSLRHNISRKCADVGLFEIGRVFPLADGRAKEERRVALALTGGRAPSFWSGTEREARCTAFDLKGILEDFLEAFGLKGVAYSRRAESTSLFHESAVIALGGKVVLGEMGLVHPMLARQYGLRDPVFMAELNVDVLLARRNGAKNFKALPQFPSVRRDLAMSVAETVSHEAVLQAVKQAKAANLDGVELFDVFRGKGLVEGTKSVAYAFTYRHPEKTLTDVEVNAAHEKLVAHLTRQLAATVR